MKNIIPLISLVLFLSTLTAAYGQEKQTDVKRTLEEQIVFEKSIPANPAKISESSQSDPKMDPASKEMSPVNWKPVDAAPVEKKEVNPASNQSLLPVNEKPGIQSDPKGAAVQPGAPEPKVKSVNFRDIKGQKTQPEGQKSDNEINYRNIKGSKLQPETESPKR